MIWKSFLDDQSMMKKEEGMSIRLKIENEIRRRGEYHARQTSLFVDYYRIRLRTAYPLPIRAIHIPDFKVREDFRSDYPWSIWMTWALEERMACLGVMAERFGSTECLEIFLRDLDGLASWPVYRQFERPDLALGHSSRTLWRSCRRKVDIPEALRQKIRSAFSRIAEDGLALSAKNYGSFRTKHDVLTMERPFEAVHNIPIIGTIGAALAAHEIGHPGQGVLNSRLKIILEALLDLRPAGVNDGVAYDGYVLDFMADWFEILPDSERSVFYDHPRFNDFLEQTYRLSVPGDAVLVAPLGDVEPFEMTFHLSAQAKLQNLKPDPVRAWHLNRCDPAKLRAEALAFLLTAPSVGEKVPLAGLLEAHGATVLRQSWDANDLAVVVSGNNSPMGHIHFDAGSILIGVRGKWWITDPGYQQYLHTREREFTVGPTAHNAPVINGISQNRKGMKLIRRETQGGSLSVELDITDCYPPEIHLSKVRRRVWLEKDWVIVCDLVQEENVESVRYHWHGHPEMGWGYESPWAFLYHPDDPNASLWVTSPQTQIEELGISRLPGSRGQ
ncbi:MAG: heparinase II/III family protein, partial [Spirochaetia bacterium]|nr:heparinase II/III family protein [Spirochaetia bacterium]